MLVTGEPEELFDSTIENPLIQFDIWDDTRSPATITQLADTFKGIFDWCSLTIAGRSHISMSRQAERLVEDEDGGWHYSVDYRIQYE